MRLWDTVKNQTPITIIQGKLIRIVESQEQIATNQLVDNLAEQQQLEELLEQSKPASSISSSALHYLLATPFRYPPLKHGSRFGPRFTPSLLYASKTKSAAFAETAYYRCYFWHGMLTAPPAKKLITEHTLFTASYYSKNGLKLQQAPFNQQQDILTDPSQYAATQQLGEEMRRNGIDAFEYISARDLKQGINVALFSPNALLSKKPTEQQQWICETTAEKVSLFSKNGKLYTYPLESFLVNAKFPTPAI